MVIWHILQNMSLRYYLDKIGKHFLVKEIAFYLCTMSLVNDLQCVYKNNVSCECISHKTKW